MKAEGIKMKNKSMTFGANLKALRKKQRYTRAQLAEVLGYSPKTIEKWELGNVLPSMENACRLAEFFEVTIDSLIYSPKPEIKYLLAVDGGGSKTEFLLTDIEKNELARCVLGASNPADIGIDNVKALLEEGIRKTCTGIHLREVAAFVGLAGSSGGNRRQILNDFLSGFGFGAFSNGSDTESMLAMALHGEDGVAVIMGTGVIAYAQVAGKRHRIGGWSYHIDKGGSGYNIASEAIYSALKHIDGRDGSEILRTLLEERLGKPLPNAISEIHGGGRATIASFAPLVFEACDRGDAYALRILDGNVREVAEMILAGSKHLANGDVKVVILGGLCHRPDLLSPLFRKYLPQGFQITFDQEPVVNGALMLAEAQKHTIEQ